MLSFVSFLNLTIIDNSLIHASTQQHIVANICDTMWTHKHRTHHAAIDDGHLNLYVSHIEECVWLTSGINHPFFVT